MDADGILLGDIQELLDENAELKAELAEIKDEIGDVEDLKRERRHSAWQSKYGQEMRKKLREAEAERDRLLTRVWELEGDNE